MFPNCFFTMHDKVVIDLRQKLHCFHYTVKLKMFLDMTYYELLIVVGKQYNNVVHAEI